MARPEAAARPELLFLDAGNTLVHIDHARIAAHLAADGIEVGVDRLRQAEWRTRAAMDTAAWAAGEDDASRWPQYIGRTLAAAGVDPAGRVESIRALDRAASLWTDVPDDVRRGLDRLGAAGIRMAVVSNSDGRVRGLLERAGLLGAFEFVLDSREEGVEKPDPEIFRRALARGRLDDAGRALHVGDIYHVDVAGARAAGIEAVLVDPGGLREGVDCRRVAGIEELAALLGA